MRLPDVVHGPPHLGVGPSDQTRHWVIRARSQKICLAKDEERAVLLSAGNTGLVYVEQAHPIMHITSYTATRRGTPGPLRASSRQSRVSNVKDVHFVPGWCDTQQHEDRSSVAHKYLGWSLASGLLALA